MEKTLSTWKINSIFFLGNSLFLVLFYHHIFQSYAFSDDYSILHNILHSSNQYAHFQKAGRPILGWFFTHTWIFLPTIDALVYARLFALLTCSLLFTCIFHNLRQKQLSPPFIIALLIAIQTSPSFAVIITWTTMYFFPLIALLAYLAGQYQLKKPFSAKSNGLSFIILFICASTYQPAITCYFIPLIFSIFFIQKESFPTIKTLLPFFITFAFANIAYLILFKLNIWPFDIEHNTRTAIGFSPLEKWQWLSTAYGNYLLPLHGAISQENALLFFQCLIGAFVTYGAFHVWRKLQQQNKWLLPILFALPLLVIYPNLATTDNYIAFRTLATATILIICLVAIAIQHLPHCAIRKGLTLMFLTLGTMLSYQNYAERIIKPTIWEYSIIEPQIRAAADAGATEIIFIRPPLHYTPTQFVKGEFGFLSTFHNWIPIRMTNLITAKFYDNPRLLTVHQYASDEPLPSWLTKRNLPIIHVVK